ncbi:MAG: cysteine methyltransferase [Desulfuromonadales bacterium C00003068]|jgi:methylated-DNA-[protein]-cysteine S-methyltransferase|nr:MAG: cysteine methyltransferase [Desulfuromonadales bacterium C00003068]
MIYTTTFDTPYCSIILAGNEEGLCHLHLDTGEGKRQFVIDEEWIEDRTFFTDVIQQINEYMTGKRQQFKVKLNPHGTVFQKRVWHELTMIGYGELESYKEVARAIGNPNGARAVGMANSKNPIPLIIPCHRVVGANGKLTGFAHGLAIKEKLIVLEQA